MINEKGDKERRRNTEKERERKLGFAVINTQNF